MLCRALPHTESYDTLGAITYGVNIHIMWALRYEERYHILRVMIHWVLLRTEC